MVVKITGRPGLGGWLEQRCHDEVLSLRQAAAKSGLSHATLSDIMKGIRPSAATIVKLAEAFGSNDHDKSELKDLLLGLSGYRDKQKSEVQTELRARLVDKLSQFNIDQLELLEQLSGFITKAGKNGVRRATSSTGVLVLPRLRLNFYLSFDEEEPELSRFYNLPAEMQDAVIGLAERYKKELGQDPDLHKVDRRSSSADA